MTIDLKELDRLHRSALDWQKFAEAASRDWPELSRALKAGKAVADSYADDFETRMDVQRRARAIKELDAAMEDIEL